LSSPSARSSSLALLALLLFTAAGPTPARAGEELARSLRGAEVVLVAPAGVHVRSEDKRATMKHNPLAGYDTHTYFDLFGERAASLFGGRPTRWAVTLAGLDEDLWRQVSTEDPDEDPPATLTSLPAVPADTDYLAIFRYAEFAYDVREQPKWSRDGRVYVVHIIELDLDLQLVIYDARTGEPLLTRDALFTVDVPEIQAKPVRSKSFYRATNGALRRMRKAVLADD
jgi:hypothetical protein